MKNRLLSIALAVLMLVTVCPSYSPVQEEPRWSGAMRLMEAISLFMPDFEKIELGFESFGGPPMHCEWPTFPCPDGTCHERCGN